MENASKALLIAGAILVVILIIGVGMMVFQSIGGTVDTGIAQMSSQQKDAFNSQFKQYEGENVTGANVKALINRINSNNSQYDKNDSQYVNLSGITDTKSVNTAHTFDVTITDTNSDGLIDKVEIKDNKSTNPPPPTSQTSPAP